MNAFYLMLIAVSLAAGPMQVGPSPDSPPPAPPVLAAGSDRADAYVEITDLSPVPPRAMETRRVETPRDPARRIIHATPRVDRGVEVASAQFASKQFDIAPIGMTSPLLGKQTADSSPDSALVGTPVGTTTLMPSSSSATMQPVEPASTRPFISPAAPVARTYVGQPTIVAPATTTIAPSTTTVFPAPARRQTIVTTPPTIVTSPQTIVTAPAPTVTLMPVVPVSGMKYGRGIIGQPKVFVDGQPVRNFLRWLSP